MSKYAVGDIFKKKSCYASATNMCIKIIMIRKHSEEYIYTALSSGWFRAELSLAQLDLHYNKVSKLEAMFYE